VSLCLLSIRRLCIMNNRHQPVPILSDIKDDVAVHIIGILKHAADFREIVPPDRLDNAHPRPNFVCSIWIVRCRLTQMARNDVH